MRIRNLPLLLALTLMTAQPSRAAETKPKYGPEATLLSRSHEFVRESVAPDFWALMPYYAAQFNERACSLASVTMLVNAARSRKNLTSEAELATQASVLKRAGSPEWEKAVGPTGGGVTLDELGPLAKKALEGFGMEVQGIETVHVSDDSRKTRSIVHDALVANEKGSRDFIIANFDQKVFTGDATVGHIAPVGAYDAKRKRVLILDPDRQWYEPYWVSEETFIRGMDTRDTTSGKNRGFIWVKLNL